MTNKANELETIKSEHMFMATGTPVRVRPQDAHDLHIEEHDAEIERLEKDAESTQSVLGLAYVNMLKAHRNLHSEYKNAQI